MNTYMLLVDAPAMLFTQLLVAVAGLVLSVWAWADANLDLKYITELNLRERRNTGPRAIVAEASIQTSVISVIVQALLVVNTAWAVLVPYQQMFLVSPQLARRLFWGRVMMMLITIFLSVQNLLQRWNRHVFMRLLSVGQLPELRRLHDNNPSDVK